MKKTERQDRRERVRILLSSNPIAINNNEAAKAGNTFSNPLNDISEDPVAQAFQAGNSLEAREKLVDNLMLNRPESKTLDQLIADAKVQREITADQAEDNTTRAERRFERKQILADAIFRDTHIKTNIEQGELRNKLVSELIEQEFRALDLESET